MDQVLHYRCPNCDGEIQFDSQSQGMKCPYCGSQFEVAEVEEYNESIGRRNQTDWQPYTTDTGAAEWNDGGISLYRCSYCGGELICEDTTAATTCPYCNNPVVLTERLSGLLRPDFVIPFALDKEQAKMALSGHLKGKKLLPRSFTESHYVDSIQGVYVPFWLFDCEADASIRYKCTRVRHWSDRNYRYTKTDYYMVLRDGNMRFDKVPVDGSSRMADNYMEALEPYDYSRMVGYRSAYLAGYLADRYDVAAADAIKRANERIRNSVIAQFDTTVLGYSTRVVTGITMQYADQRTRYALLPVWLVNAQYNGKTYSFAMNGQTGKFVGELPVDWKKFWLWVLMITLIGTPVIFLLLTLIYYYLQ